MGASPKQVTCRYERGNEFTVNSKTFAIETVVDIYKYFFLNGAHDWPSSFVLKPDCFSSALTDSERFRSVLRAWFEKEGRSHPWRETQEPWAILVSEVMLQQTTVGAVREGRRFEKFLREFPSLAAIASAPEEKLLKAWEGLGYYYRVRNLQKTAQTVIAEWGGVFPQKASDLETLPGVGPYTAGALASFAFNEPAPIVDGNVARIFSRIFNDETEVDSAEGVQQLWKWAQQLLDSENPRVYNSALMEVGQVYCRPRKPDCLNCPIASFCATSEPEGLPRKKPKAKVIKVVEHALLAKRRGQILLAKEEGSRRKGFYRLPLRSSEEVADLELLETSKYAITKHRVTLHLYQAANESSKDARPGESWVTEKALQDLPMASPVRKVLERVLKEK